MQSAKKENCKSNLKSEVIITEDSAKVEFTQKYSEAKNVNRMTKENQVKIDSDHELFQKLKLAAQTIRWKTGHQELDFESSLAEAARQNDKLTAWHNSGERLNNLWMFINGEELFQAPLPQVPVSAMPEAAEGTRLEFWHCDENNQKDFLLFIYKIERLGIRGVVQDLTPTQTLGINVRFCPNNNHYFVIWRVGERDKTERDVTCQMKADREILERELHGRAIPAGYDFHRREENRLSVLWQKFSGVISDAVPTNFIPNLAQLSVLVAVSTLFLSVLTYCWFENSRAFYNVPEIIDSQYLVADSVFTDTLNMPDSENGVIVITCPSPDHR